MSLAMIPLYLVAMHKSYEAAIGGTNGRHQAMASSA
jgi:hypothetical protein